jgi:hypothetical protein
MSDFFEPDTNFSTPAPIDFNPTVELLDKGIDQVESHGLGLIPVYALGDSDAVICHDQFKLMPIDLAQ